MQETEKKEFNIWDYIWKNRVNLAFLFSLVALVLSGYNTYRINSGTVAALGVPGAVVGEKPEKILKELPKNAPVLGNPNAKLTIVEFADFQCPFCGKFHNSVFPSIKSEYIDTGKVKIVYLDYAFLGQESLDAAEAAKCAAEQGKFWEYHNQIYTNQRGENQNAFNTTVLRGFATNTGLDLAQFDLCVSQNKYDTLISEELSLGKKYGVTGTPAFLIGKQVIKGSSNIETFRSVIDAELK